MQPMLGTFIRLTLMIAIAIAVIALAGWLFHLVVIAAVIAAVVVGGLFLYNMIRGRAKTPAIRQ
ncbi:MAG TPA: hypothetical protein VMB20_08395 [Candidatus Acidoferrum sp.]|nr:hypothetical protein [Candidatus Acidoferrum sp.]